MQQSLSSVGTAINTTNTAVKNSASSFNTAATAVANLSSSAGRGVSDLKANVAALNEGATAAENFGKAAGLAARRYAASWSLVEPSSRLSKTFKGLLLAAIDFEREMVKLTQVGAGTATEIKGIETEVTRLSTSLGVSSKELIQTSVTLAQAGLNAKQTAQALEALALSALSPNFGTLAETVEGSIAVMQQFKIEAGGLQNALGSMNAVAGAFAVESKDLIEAVKRGPVVRSALLVVTLMSS